VVSAVIFDFYGTLAHWADDDGHNYQAVFAAHGHALDPSVLQDYFTRYDGVDHAEHSVSEEAYEAWVRARLGDLTAACGVEGRRAELVIDALRDSDRGGMVTYPEAAATLSALRGAGLAVGVCSNWGWELDAFLREVGLLHLVDAGVTSARAGARKPHPGIYARAAESLDVDPRQVLFVGDSWEPDVRGPRRQGMAAVHVWRADERGEQCAPPLEPGDHRVEELTGVLELLGLSPRLTTGS
jgi:putative hydrolase of the HAD superfamily